MAAVVQSPTDSTQTVFAGALRQSSIDTVRLAFEFARAQAAIPQATTSENPPPDAARGRTLAQSAAAAAQRAELSQAELDRLNLQLQSASGAGRARLQALRDEVASEANFAKARRDALRNLIGFLSAPDEGGLGAKILTLERSIPEAAPALKGTPEPAPAARPAATPDFHPESSGIVGLTAEVFSLSQRMNQLERLSQETEALRQSAEKLRGPLRSALREVIRRGDAITQLPESSNIEALNTQRKQIDAQLARFKQLSASSSPLSEQAAQINSSRGRIVEWRRALGERYNSALRYLLLRIVMLAVALLLIFGLSELARRATVRYVQDLRRRRQFLVLRRIVVGCAVALLIILSFVTEFGSLATFAGFSAAGIAVAMQSVILSVVAYFFLVGRWGVRVGDRVTVSGVTGEVADVGLFRLYLLELGGSGPALEPTGRIVVFPNAVFFQPSAMFKQLPGIDYVWRAVILKFPGRADYAQLERRLMDAVQTIWAEYRDVVERQHGNFQSSLLVHTEAPRPESRIRFIDAGLEITIRYPVEIRRIAEIDDRVTREFIQLLDAEPALSGNEGAKFKIESVAG
ncbi:mechanosensitive ion channel family protein [Paludibaculum fermentans]|uniref:Mechanosensitive ion channel family protein n=1 Tax=Paludibaculum fermentans TaxID=1473598 RepID=A0A7S7NPT9_PALFE|nr:mechanosensitive ion channel family protein [Paludibaculum fermentans]QOY87552.1 mechanosensitive ion channel family protein [Paludibaculum fermentans]